MRRNRMSRPGPYVASSFVRSTICGKRSALAIAKVWHDALTPAFSSCATLLCMLSINDELAFLFFKMNVLTKTFLPRSGPSRGIPLLSLSTFKILISLHP